MLTKGAIGNLINRYRAVLKKCNLINTFGSLAVASMLVLGGAGVAGANYTISSGDFGAVATAPYEGLVDHQGGAFRVTGGVVTGSGSFIGNRALYENTDTVLSSAPDKPEGGAIYISGASAELTVSNATFKDNIASGRWEQEGKYFPISKTEGQGGAISNSGTTVVENSFFEKNASYAAGAIFNAKKLTVSQSHFLSNLSDDGSGGAIKSGTNDAKAAYTKKVSISNSIFESNYSMDGGVLYNSGGSETSIEGTSAENFYKNDASKKYTGTLFDNNHAFRKGGAIANEFNGCVTLTGNITFSNNGSGQFGGAIYNDVKNANDKISLHFDSNSNVVFERNVSLEKGGAIYNSGLIEIDGTNKFEGNASGENGGAIYNGGTINFYGTNTFKNNVANATMETSDGINIVLLPKVSASFTQKDIQSKIYRAVADSGTPNDIYNTGTINVLSGKTELNSGMVQNKGYTVVAKGAELKIAAGSFSGTQFRSEMVGGALHNSGNTTFTSGISTISNNLAFTNGGALHNEGIITTLDDSELVISGNIAFGIEKNGNAYSVSDKGHGGAIANSNANNAEPTLNLNGKVTFQNNSAAANGGAIYNPEDGTINIKGEVNFTGNTAQGTTTLTPNSNGGTSVGFTPGTPNDIHNEGTIKITGGTTTLKSGLTGTDTGKITNEATFVADGATLSGYIGTYEQTAAAGVTDITKAADYFGGAVNIEKGTLLADYGMMTGLNETQTGNLAVNAGASLNLDYSDVAEDGTYSLTQYFAIKDKLMADDGGQLILSGAELAYDKDNDTILLGQKNNGVVDEAGVLFALKGKQSYEAATADPAQSNLPDGILAGTMVTLTDTNLTESYHNSAEEVTFSSDLTAQGMYVGNMAHLIVDGEAKLTFAATNDKGLFVNAEGKDAPAVTIAEGASLTLGIANMGTQNATLGNIDVAGTFNVGTSTDAANYSFKDVKVTGKHIVSGKLTDGEPSTSVAYGNLINEGETSFTNSSVTVSEFTNKGETSLNKSDVKATGLTLAGGSMTVKDSSLIVGKMTASGGSFFADPSSVIIKDLTGNKLGTALTVGKDTSVVIGGDSIDDAVAGASAYTDGKAALVLGKHIELSGAGGILVDPKASASDIPAAGSARFAEGSLLAADGHLANSDEQPAIITGTGELKVDKNAMLYISNVAANETYTVAEGFSSYDVDETAWSQENDTLILNGLVDSDIKAITHDDGSVELVTSTKIKEDSVFFDAIPSDALRELAEEGADIDAGNTGAVEQGKKFLSRAVESPVIGYTKNVAEGVALVNEVSRAAVTAGVQNTSLRIADAASNTVLDHLSLASHTASVHADGADFWAAPMYGNLYTSGMATAGSSVRGQFGGLALGADLEAGQFLGGQFRLGAAINGGGGQSETKGNVTSTQNDYDFGGLNFYAAWNKGALNVMGSVGYGFGNHEVEMGIPATMGMGSAKADIDTSVFTADLLAEYQLKTDWVDVLPHVGVRYTALNTEAHDLKVGGKMLNSVESNTQNIVQFPIGVTLSKDFAFADWTVKPMADVSVIPAVGDKKATTKVNFSGLEAWDSVNTRIMDSTSWAGTVGVQAEKGKFTFGLNYGVQASSNETDQNVQVKLGWKF